MSLSSGARLGVYDIIAKLGEGGMGEVYRAHDTKLDRDVAIKVLSQAVAGDAERIARFEREARSLAALNHPNVAQIYAVDNGAIVMELVPGETLRGPLPLGRALDYAAQIASALDAAHEKGLVHRDLKPGNIMVTPEGEVKVLDFGLAARPAPTSGADPALSPTMTAQTRAGTIMGTAAYMAPEQASGKPVDKRADIWAFGVVLWEMLTGRQLFEGETTSHVLAAVLTKEPDLNAVPTRVRLLLGRCLEKDAKKRLRDIGDAMSLVGDPAVAAAGVGGKSHWRSAGGWVLAGVAAALATMAWLRPAAPVETHAPVVRFQVPRPNIDAYINADAAFALSPDGSMLAYYGAGRTGAVSVIIRSLASGESRELIAVTGNPQPNAIVWSPDGRYVIHGTSGSGAHIVDVAAATSRLLCECRFKGGTWNRDGVILLGSAAAGDVFEGIRRFSASGRDQAMVTKVDASRRERDLLPFFLPDGRRFLFTRSSEDGQVTYLGFLDGAEPVRLVEGSRSIFVPAVNSVGPYLMGIEAAGLVAQAFDPASLTVSGEAWTVVAGAGVASVSDNGVLATSPNALRPGVIPTWFDRQGKSLGGVGEPARAEFVALSPDGSRLALNDARENGIDDIWLRDVATGTSTRFTFGAGAETAGVWSHDGTRMIYSAARDGRLAQPTMKTLDGTGPETAVVKGLAMAWVNDWSPDGRFAIFSQWTDTMDMSLWSVTVGGAADQPPSPYISERGNQKQAQISPDGRFVAYISDETGAWEIYVRPFPNAQDGKWMVSNGGGLEPRWSRDGRELFYFSGQKLMTVPVSLRPTFSYGTRRALFETRVQSHSNDGHRWQVSPDGQRFLLLMRSGQEDAPALDVIVNWSALLKR